MNPLFSIIVPLYNKEQSIRKTIVSILEQKYDNFEILVIDDGSTDNSLAIVENIDDRRIRVFSKKNEGVSSARNYGIKKANGTYVLFLDADDFLLPNCLKHYNDLIMNYPNIKVFTTNFKVINTNMETYTYCKKNKRIVLLDAYKDFYLNKIFLRAGNTFIHISCFDKVGLFNEKLKYYEDLEFDIRLLDAFQLVYSPEVTFIYSRNYSSLSIAKQDFNNGFISIARINNGSFYRKMLIAEHITIYLSKYIVQKNWKLFWEVFKIHKNKIHFLLLSFVFIQIKKIQDRLDKG